MSKLAQIFLRWLPALIMMIGIFLISGQPSSHLPNFGGVDGFVKKSGHVISYAILAFLYWRGLNFRGTRRWVAWLFAILYAITDEFHQRLVAGRHPSIWDVVIFDNLGALASLWLASWYRKQKRPDPFHPIAEAIHR